MSTISCFPSVVQILGITVQLSLGGQPVLVLNLRHRKCKTVCNALHVCMMISTVLGRMSGR